MSHGGGGFKDSCGGCDVGLKLICFVVVFKLDGCGEHPTIVASAAAAGILAMGGGITCVCGGGCGAGVVHAWAICGCGIDGGGKGPGGGMMRPHALGGGHGGGARGPKAVATEAVTSSESNIR